MGLPSLVRRALSSIKYGFARTRCARRGHPPTPAENGIGPISSSEIASEFAHHDPDVARVNNGSFGCCPASVLAAQAAWQLLYLRQPDDFVLNRLQPSILRSRAILRGLINAAHVDEVSIVDNVTTASAAVLQHLSWAFREGVFGRGDAVVVLQHGYPAVKKSLRAYISRAGGRVVEAPLPFPVTSDDEIAVGFRRALALGKSDGRHKVRLAVIDHVTSMPSVVVPVKELTRICREEGVEQVFIDGAHAVGNVDIDVEDIGADYYTSNLHKWLFCPPAAAFLYCRRNPDDLHHPVVSHEFGRGMAAESGWVGTRDYSAYLVLPSIMDFVERFEGGIRGIQKRNHEKAVEMAEMLAGSWDTGLGAPPEMCSSMVMVGLPGSLRISSDGDAIELRRRLREEFKVEVHVLHHNSSNEPNGDGRVTGYVRISHQVYNGVDDYHRLRDAINKLVQDQSKLGDHVPAAAATSQKKGESSTSTTRSSLILDSGRLRVLTRGRVLQTTGGATALSDEEQRRVAERSNNSS